MESKHTMELDRRRFETAWKALGATHDNASAWLVARYAEPHRAYHNAEHISECLAWFDQLKAQAQRPAELEVALFFHDAIYNPLSPNNEAESAARFQAFAEAAAIPRETAARVTELILSTASHAAESSDAALLNSIDLAVLGAPPARYARYERDIRREYVAVEEHAYRAGRSRVLRDFLARLEIYRTPSLAARLEAQARTNLSRALSALQP